MIFIEKDDTAKKVCFVVVQSGNPMRRMTSASGWSCYYSVNGGSATAMTTPTVTELDSINMPGVYAIDIDESGMVGTIGQLVVNIKANEAAHVTLNIRVDETTTTDCLAAIDTRFSFASGYVKTDMYAIRADTTAADNAKKVFNNTGYAMTNSTMGTVTTTTNVTNPVTASSVTDKTGYALSAAGVDAIHDEVGTGHGGGGLTLFGYVSTISTYLAPFVGTDGKCLISTDNQDLSSSLGVYAKVVKLVNQTLTAQAGENWETFFNNAASATTKTVDDVGGGSGGSSAAEIADAVWDELSTGHTDAGKAGAQLWTDVDAIKAKTDNLPADPASESNVDANETKIDAVKTVADAVQAKTDNLPSDPADQSQVEAAITAAHSATTTSLAAEINANEAKIDIIDTNVDAVKAKTDNISFTGTDIKATLDGEEVTTDAASRTASKADVSGLATTAALTTVGTNVTSILDDTGAQLPAGQLQIYNALVATDAVVDSIKVDTGTTIDGKLDTIITKTDYLPDGFKKNTAFANFMFTMVDASDGYTVLSGEDVTAQRAIDAGGLSACTNSVTEISGTGIYRISLSADDLNGDFITFRFTSDNAADHVIHVKTEQ